MVSDPDEYERSAREGLEVFGRAGPWSFIGVLHLAYSHFLKGAWDEARRECDEALDLAPPKMWAGWVVGSRFLLQAYGGERGWLDDWRARKPVVIQEAVIPFAGDRFCALLAAEALALVGERDEAHTLYPEIVRLLQDGLKGSNLGVVETTAAISAACGTQWETAQQHFETALRQARDIPSRFAQPETRRWYAWMLLDRNGPGDHERARTLLNEAIELYGAIGMPRHLEMAREMLKDV